MMSLRRDTLLRAYSLPDAKKSQQSQHKKSSSRNSLSSSTKTMCSSTTTSCDCVVEVVESQIESGEDNKKTRRRSIFSIPSFAPLRLRSGGGFASTRKSRSLEGSPDAPVTRKKEESSKTAGGGSPKKSFFFNHSFSKNFRSEKATRSSREFSFRSPKRSIDGCDGTGCEKHHSSLSVATVGKQNGGEAVVMMVSANELVNKSSISEQTLTSCSSVHKLPSLSHNDIMATVRKSVDLTSVITKHCLGGSHASLCLSSPNKEDGRRSSAGSLCSSYRNSLTCSSKNSGEGSPDCPNSSRKSLHDNDQECFHICGSNGSACCKDSFDSNCSPDLVRVVCQGGKTEAGKPSRNMSLPIRAQHAFCDSTSNCSKTENNINDIITASKCCNNNNNNDNNSRQFVQMRSLSSDSTLNSYNSRATTPRKFKVYQPKTDMSYQDYVQLLYGSLSDNNNNSNVEKEDESENNNNNILFVPLHSGFYSADNTPCPSVNTTPIGSPSLVDPPSTPTGHKKHKLFSFVTSPKYRKSPSTSPKKSPLKSSLLSPKKSLKSHYDPGSL